MLVSIRKTCSRLALIVAVSLLVAGLLIQSAAAVALPRADDFVIAVVLVIDVSGSMREYWVDGVKIESARFAAHELIDLLETEDRVPGRRYLVGLVEFDGTASVLQSPTSDFNLLRTQVDGLVPRGYTNIGAGLELALNELNDTLYDRAYIVLLSDGVTNRGRSPRQILDWLARDTPAGSGQILQASVYGADRPERAEIAAARLGEAGFHVDLFVQHDGKSTALSRLPADAVFSFNGHANWNVLGFNTRGWFGRLNSDRLTIDHVAELDLSPMVLAVLAGCKTAKPVDRDNITREFVNRGAGVAIGFADWTNNSALIPWLDLFWEALIDHGLSIATAFDLANLANTFYEYESSGRTYRLMPLRVQASVAESQLTLAEVMKPEPTTTDPRIDRAVNWATGMLGQTYSPGEDFTAGGYYYSCLAFVQHAYMHTGSGRRLGALGTAARAARTLNATEQYGEPPPRGAWVFYDWETDGHVALAIGDGQVIHSLTNVTAGVARITIDRYDRVPGVEYIGWAWPDLDPPVGDVLAAHLSPRVFTVGFGDPVDLDEPLLRAIAGVTGGQYFYGGESFSLANTFVKTQHLGTGTILAELGGTVGPGERTVAGAFAVSSRDRELRVALNWPGSQVDLVLTDPRGSAVGPDYRGVSIWRTERPAYVVVDDPTPGEWTVEVYGSDVPAGGSPFYVVASTSDIMPYRGDALEFLVVLSGVLALTLWLAPRLLPDVKKGVDQA